MKSWGELWDTKQELANKALAPTSQELNDEKTEIQKTISQSKENFKPTYELEIRSQGVESGLVATQDQIKDGVEWLDGQFFPHSSDFGGNKMVAKSTFSNECHDENGKFCETHGTVHNAEEKEKPKKLGFFGTLKALKQGVVEGQQGINQMKEEKAAEAAKNAPKTNEWGFSEEQLNTERQDIIKQFKRGEHGILNPASRGWTDRVDAETRAQAVAQGRIANKGELKRGRNKAVSANWGGLIGLGLLAKHL